MNQALINLVLALTAGELVHNVIESQEVRKKVAWLRLSLAGKPYVDKIPFRIDTRAKSYAISFAGLVGFTAVSFVVFSILNLSLHVALGTLVVLLVLAYIATTVILDKYHVEIAGLTPTKPTRKK